jgi:hypothetical protein
MEFWKFLGKNCAEQSVGELLRHFGITDVPRLKRGDDTTYLSSHERGVELTFVDSESLDDLDRYPHGALVLANIRFYGMPGHKFSRYVGDLPQGLQYKNRKTEIVSLDLPN